MLVSKTEHESAGCLASSISTFGLFLAGGGLFALIFIKRIPFEVPAYVFWMMLATGLVLLLLGAGLGHFALEDTDQQSRQVPTEEQDTCATQEGVSDASIED